MSEYIYVSFVQVLNHCPLHFNTDPLGIGMGDLEASDAAKGEASSAPAQGSTSEGSDEDEKIAA